MVSIGLFCLQSFLSLSKKESQVIFIYPKLIQNSKVSPEVKPFAWLMGNGKVNTHDLLQIRRLLKALSVAPCVLSGGRAYHLFLHCCGALDHDTACPCWPVFPLLIMMIISFANNDDYFLCGPWKKIFRVRVLCKGGMIAILMVIWLERNVKISEEKHKSSECLWESVRIHISL